MHENVVFEIGGSPGSHAHVGLKWPWAGKVVGLDGAHRDVQKRFSVRRGINLGGVGSVKTV